MLSYPAEMRRRRHLTSRVATLTAILSLVIVGAALAALKSGTYKGNLTGHNKAIAITMKLAGKKLSAISIDGLPLYCQGGGGPVKITFKSTSISNTGTFTTTAAYKYSVGLYKGQVGNHLSLKGKFKSGGTVSGTLKTTYVRSPSCGGSEGFSAKA